MTRVFILAEIRLYRDGLAQVLGREPALEVVGTASAWPDAAPLVERLRPEIVLLDIATTKGLEAAGEILAHSCAPKVVALGIRDDEDDLLACAEAGVSGYVTREDSLETMIAAIESVARGELLCSPRMAAVLFERVSALTAGAGSRPDAFRLTAREREIVELIDDGYSNKAIAQQLRIELATVKNHVHNILEKLQVHRRSDAAARLRAERARP